MQFTGERFVPGLHGSIELEHLHRYLQACEIARGKVVLDIACGEGYGSKMLAECAQKVYGVDISVEAIEHARMKYNMPNLDYFVGSCADIPLSDGSIDLVVSFETIEHHDQHREMMAEIKRVLKPDGVLLISSPDKLHYSIKANNVNPHHVKELFESEFRSLLGDTFSNVGYFAQRVIYGSGIFGVGITSDSSNYRLENKIVEKISGLKAPMYWVAIASNGTLPPVKSGILEQSIEDSEMTAFWRGLMQTKDSELGKASSSLQELNNKIEIEGRINRDFQAREEASTNLRSALIRQFTESLSELEKKVLISSATLVEKDLKIAELEKNLSELNACLIAERRSNLGREFHVVELEQAVGSAQQKNVALSRENAVLQNKADSLIASNSWRMTAPLRRLGDFKLHFRNTAASLVLKAYRALPLTPLQKKKLKDAFFRIFGFALGEVGAYKNWKEFRDMEATWGGDQVSKVEKATAEAVRSDAVVASTQVFPVADGIWEWRDYDLVKNRILAVSANRRENLSTARFDIIEVGSKDLVQVARNIHFAQLSQSPLVSIILPVFNNISLTVECLLSIEKYVESDISFEIVVADDASTDRTSEVLSGVSNIIYSRSDVNQGFLANCNRVLPQTKGSFVLYLNNDVQVTKGWMSALLGTFDSHEKVGAVGPKFVYPSGYLQEAGAAFMPDGTSAMIGLNDDPAHARYSYVRRVDYISGACLLLRADLLKKLGGFSEDFLPCYCEDADLCLRVRSAGYDIYYNPAATIVHHLSKTTAAGNTDFKMRCLAKNFATLQDKWSAKLAQAMNPRILAFFLPQFHPIPENDRWWGTGFTEWSNVSKAQPNFVGHYQPRVPADLGYYDLRLIEVMEQQAALAQKYGIHGFCYYYYWFDGKRILERPLEQLLQSLKPDLPFCLCWANENWTKRWDGLDHDVLMAQSHTAEDDVAVIEDLMRFFRDSRYIKVDGRPLILIYRVTMFPDFSQTAARWRAECRKQGIGEIYISMVESFDLVHSGTHPSKFGCDAAVEFPPQGLADQKSPSGEILNSNFAGSVADYRDLAVRYATREAPAYTRFKGVMPGWDNTARRQNNSFCFEYATPGAFQGWLEETIKQTRLQNYGDERLVFVNAWNEWAEGAYLEPDRRFGHTYLEAVKNAVDAPQLLGKHMDRGAP